MKNALTWLRRPEPCRYEALVCPQFVTLPLQNFRNFTGATSTAVAAAPQNSAEPPLTLVGTIGNSLAMLKTRDGKIELKGVGESISGITILTITPAKVEARYNGRTISLDKQRRG